MWRKFLPANQLLSQRSQCIAHGICDFTNMAADTLKYVFLKGNGTFLFEFQPVYRKQTISFWIINSIIHVGRNENTIAMVQLGNVFAPKKRRDILASTGLLHHSYCVYEFYYTIRIYYELCFVNHTNRLVLCIICTFCYTYPVNKVLSSSWKTVVIVLRQDSIII